MSLRLTESERALVLLWRAFLAYQDSRHALHKLRPREDDDGHALDEDDESCWLTLHADGSGTVRIDPADTAKREHDAVTWWDLPQAAAKVEAGTVAVERVRFGNPQRGRTKGRARR